MPRYALPSLAPGSSSDAPLPSLLSGGFVIPTAGNQIALRLVASGRRSGVDEWVATTRTRVALWERVGFQPRPCEVRSLGGLQLLRSLRDAPVGDHIRKSDRRERRCGIEVSQLEL